MSTTKRVTSPRSSALTRLAQVCMTFFFAYATFVQQNDPDCLFWQLLYGCACLAALLDALSPSNRLSLVAFSLLIPFAFGTILSQYLREGFLDLSPKTEVGRENGGSSIVLVWSLLSVLILCRRDLTTVQRWLMIGIAVVLSSSVYVIPKFYLQTMDTTGHCEGVGFASGTGETSTILERDL